MPTHRHCGRCLSTSSCMLRNQVLTTITYGYGTESALYCCLFRSSISNICVLGYIVAEERLQLVRFALNNGPAIECTASTTIQL